MVSRMLWSKGVVPFWEAAHIVKREYPDAEFLLIGGSKDDYGPQNDNFVPIDKLQELTRDGCVRWIGLLPPADAEQVMADATAVVLLSSYGEGVPRVLIEAAALGAPIITTNMPGCRDVVADKKSGFLCNGAVGRDDGRLAREAANAMMSLINRPHQVAEMGKAGREMAKKFDASRVMAETMEAFESEKTTHDLGRLVVQRAP
jgi:glycosyltransferase involved in cell wall biosynthesis